MNATLAPSDANFKAIALPRITSYNVCYTKLLRIEVPYIRGQIGANLDVATRKKYVSNIVFGALHKTEINK